MRFILIGGLIFFFGSFALAPTAFEKYRVDRLGQLVDMKIEKLPGSCIGARVRYFVYFSYNGRLYDKATRGAYCEEHHVGEIVKMKMLEGSKYIMFPHESGLMELISLGMLGCFGLGLAISQYTKQRKSQQRRAR